MSERKNFLIEFYRRRSIPVNPDHIAPWNVEDSLKPLRRMVATLEGPSVRMEEIENGIVMLDAHFE